MIGTLLGFIGGPIGAIGVWIWKKIGPYLIMAGVVGLVALAAYFYIKHTNATIDSLKSDLVQEKLKADSLELVNQNMQKQYAELKAMTDKFNADWTKLLEEKSKSQKEIFTRNYKKEANTNSKQLTIDLNNSWANTFKDLEDLSHAQ